MNNNAADASSSSNGDFSTGKRPVGPVIGLIIILAIILIGGIYFWSSRMNSKTNMAPENNQNSAVNNGESASSEAILNQSSSDETASIEADLNAFNESDIDRLGSDL